MTRRRADRPTADAVTWATDGRRTHEDGTHGLVARREVARHIRETAIQIPIEIEYRVEYREHVYRVRLDLSTNVKPSTAPDPFVTLTVTEHHGGELFADYLRMLGKIKKAEEQEGASTVIRYVLNVGEGAKTVAARGSKTLAERMTFPNQGAILTKVFGAADAADMNELITKTIAKRSTVIMAHRPDLSSPAK